MMTGSEAISGKDNIQQVAGRVQIVYYTDPLCCWSYAMQPHWQKLKEAFSGDLSYRYCMGGLLPDWSHFNDTELSVSRPAQMGPVWMHASQVSGTPIKSTLWIHDPPASSYPACIAVKCAELQSKEAGEQYLQLLSYAAMAQGQNIAKQHVLIETAKQLTAPGFDVNMFIQMLATDQPIEAFRNDINEVRQRGIQRFPTLIVRSNTTPPSIIRGYRPYTVLEELVIKHLESTPNNPS